MEEINQTILSIAINTPLRKTFDYLPPEAITTDKLIPGIRIVVPFGKQKQIGILLQVKNTTDLPLSKLKNAFEVLDENPILPTTILSLCDFASEYYQHPIGEVIVGSLPTALREGQAAVLSKESLFRLTPLGANIDIAELKYAHQQSRIVELLKKHTEGLSRQELLQYDIQTNALTALIAKGYVQKYSVDKLKRHPITSHLVLNEHQSLAVSTITKTDSFFPYLLEGVTGSGKTEVYLQIMAHLLSQQKQVLILVPEIGLTPQTLARFQSRFAVPIAVLHSGLSEKERLHAWLEASQGIAQIIIGTRSAIFTPMPNLKLIILDEEHDASFKQQSGFRYSAKDLAVMRGKIENIPVVLGTATPSLETFYNAKKNRFVHLKLPNRVANAIMPKFHLLDIRNKKLEEGLSPLLLQQMEKHLAHDGQILLFLNRRGFAPILLCHQCGWTAQCHRCDARLAFHNHLQQLICHHCGTQRKIYARCSECHSKELLLLGLGTERLEQILRQHFPDIPAIRIDRDSTRRKGSMEKMLANIQNGQSRIMIGTQMLSKGHHFPNVTMVGIIDIDSSLYSLDFRAQERLGQTIIQVSGRAGRADKPGEVFIQTHNPNHPLLLKLIDKGYTHFAESLLHERKSAILPPFSYLALFRAEATKADAPQAFLTEVKNLLQATKNESIKVLGPIPAMMERKAGKYRAQLLIQTKQRQQLQKLLQMKLLEIESLPSKRHVRWSIDIDPIEIS